MSDSISTKVAFEASYPSALAVYCSDGRFTDAVDELLDKLGHPRLDTLTIPGGPGLLNHKTSGYSDCDTFSRSAEFLIREHHITTVVLLAHDACGFYGRKFPDLTSEQIRSRQLDDLRLAMRELLETHPRLRVEAFVAVPTGDHVRFDPVDR
jgi:carbonic anhydrase